MNAQGKAIVVVAVAVAVGTFFSVFAYEWVKSSEWPTEYLNWTAVEDGFYQMAWDSDGHLQLAFIGTSGPYYALNYGERIGREWHITSISRLFYEHEGVSMALDSENNVYICTYAYREVDFTTLGPHVLFATNKGGSWSVEILNTTGYCDGAGLAVDANDKVHLFYADSVHRFDAAHNTSLVHMELTPSGWEKTVLTCITGAENYIWINDVDGRPDGSTAVLYTTLLNGTYLTDPGSVTFLNYSIYSNGQFSSSVAMDSDDGEWRGMSLCHDASGNAYISAERKMIDDWILCYVTNSGGDWALTDVAYGGNSAWSPRTWITLDEDENMYIAYFAEGYDGAKSNHTVRYVTNDGGVWHARVIDDCTGWSVAESIALVVDESGDVHVVYFQRTTSPDHGDRDRTVYTTSQLDPDRFVDALPVSTFPAILFSGVAILITLLLIRRRQFNRHERGGLKDAELYDDR
jgi:hypothetical protein